MWEIFFISLQNFHNYEPHNFNMAINYCNGQIKKAVVVAMQCYHISFSPPEISSFSTKNFGSGGILFNLNILIFDSLLVPNAFAYFTWVLISP